MATPETEPADLPELEPAADPDAEPAEPEPEPEPESAPEPETERGEPEARAPSAAQLRAFERENSRHEAKLSQLIGADWEFFAPCPACGGVGFAPTEVVDTPDIVDAPGVIECTGCRGYGRLRTPSRVPGQEFQVCIDCAGNGWKREAPAAAEPAAPVLAPVGNGTSQAPPGYILVKIDPNAPDAPAVYPPHPVAAPAYAP